MEAEPVALSILARAADGSMRDALSLMDQAISFGGGTVRADFGTDIMVNTAHASDSAENASREMRIVKMQQNGLARIIDDYLAERQGS